MTAKKLWARKFYNDSQETETYSQDGISWTSSDSECDESNRAKRTKSNNWIKASLADEFGRHVDGSQNCIVNETVQIVNSPSLESNNFEESPIINSLLQGEQSPVLTESIDGNNFNETSPVIGKRGILKKVRSKYKRINKVKQNIFQTREKSPDIFQSQPSQLIDSNFSPESQFEKNIHISQSSECFEPASSQVTKQLSNTSSSTRTDNSSLYHQPRRKRKRYKKGGLAHLLQKTLRLQKTRISRWQHEMYTKRADSFLDLSDGDVIEFVVKKFYVEYGSVLVEGELLHVKNENSSGKVSLDSTLSEEMNQLILVVVSSLVNVTFTEGEKYQVYPPYCSKKMLYKSQEIVCYFNVSKIVVSKR